MTGVPTVVDTRQALTLSRRLVGLIVVDMLATAALGAWFVVRTRYAAGLLIGDGAPEMPAAAVATLAVWAVVTAVTTLVWARWTNVVVSLLASLGREPAHPAWWATLGWVVPPWAVFAPPVVMTGLWKGSTPGPTRRGSRLVPLWWALALVGHPVLIVGALLTRLWQVASIASLAWIAAGLVAVRLVSRISSRALTLGEMEGNQATGWRTLPAPGRVIPMVAVLVAVVGFVGYQAFAIAESLVGAINGWQTEDVEVGLCFGGVGGERITAVVDAPCAEPHDGEVVGTHLLQAGAEGTWDAGLLETFAVGMCRASAEAYVGERVGDLGDRLVVTWPTRTQWVVDGERDVSCLLLVDPGTTGSVARPDERRVPHRELEVGDCYVDEVGWITAKLVECRPPALEVVAVEILDRTLTAPRPSQESMDGFGDRVCPPSATRRVPDLEEWQHGSRVLVCAEPA